MATCSGFIEPLNLECWLINVLSGTEIIFTLISMIFISYLSAKLRMTNGTGVMFIGLFAVMFGVYVSGLAALVVLIGGFILFVILRRVVSTR